MNKGIFIGNLVRDPEMRTAASTGETFCTFTIAVNRRGTNGDSADFIDCTAYGNLGGVCQEYLKKGKKVMVEGRISARAWASRDGSPRAGLSLSVREMEMLTPKGAPAEPTEAPEADAEGFTEVDDDELPF